MQITFANLPVDQTVKHVYLAYNAKSLYKILKPRKKFILHFNTPFDITETKIISMSKFLNQGIHKSDTYQTSTSRVSAFLSFVDKHMGT